MYCKYQFAQTATLQEVANDIVGMLTGTVTAANQLSPSANLEYTEFVAGQPAEWTLIDTRANTSTRIHVILEAPDHGGFKRTMGLIFLAVSGNIHMIVWFCGPWDVAARTPKAYDVTGRLLSTSGGQVGAADFSQGSVANSVFTLSTSGSALGISGYTYGPLTGGSQQLVISSIAYNSQLSFHYGTTHSLAIGCYSIDRTGLGSSFSAANWPYPLYVASNLATANGHILWVPGVNLLTNHSGVSQGLIMGQPYSATRNRYALSGTEASELAVGYSSPLITTTSSTYTFTGFTPNNPPVRQLSQSLTSAVGSWVAPARQLTAYVPEVGPIATGVKLIGSTSFPMSSSTTSTIGNYPDEVVAGAEKWVFVGGTLGAFMSPPHYKG